MSFSLPTALSANKLVTDKVIWVDKDGGGGDFIDIAPALAYRAANFGPTDEVLVKLEPSLTPYIIDNSGGPLAFPGYTELSSTGLIAANIGASDPGVVFETSGGNCNFRNLIFQISSGQTAIRFTGAGLNAMEWLSCLLGGTLISVEDSNSTVIFRNCQGISCNVLAKMTAGNLIAKGGNWASSCDIGFDIQGGLAFLGDSTMWVCSTAGVKASGTATVSMQGSSTFICGTGILIDDTASVRLDSYQDILSTASIVQAKSTAVIIANGLAAGTTKFSIADSSTFVAVNVFDNEAGGLRYKKQSYSASSPLSPNDQLSAVTAGAITLTLPTVNVGPAVSNEYPVKLQIIDESGLGTSTLAAAGGDTLNGVVNGTLPIPAIGSLTVYSLTTGWRTL